MLNVLASVDRESSISLISLSISKILPLNLSMELSILFSLELRSDKSCTNEKMCGTTERSEEEAEKNSTKVSDTTAAAASAG